MPVANGGLERWIDRNARLVVQVRKLAAAAHRAEGHQEAATWITCSHPLCRAAQEVVSDKAVK